MWNKRYFILTMKEMDLLYGLQYLCWPIYCHVRKLMDHETGITGILYPIALNSFADNCRIEEGQGKCNTGKPSIAKIRTALENLIKVGLLESRSIVTAEQKKLIFYMPIAFEYLCARNKVSRFSTQKEPTEVDTGITQEKFLDSTTYNTVAEKVRKEDRTHIDEKFRTYKRRYNNINTHTDVREISIPNDKNEKRNPHAEIKSVNPQLVDKTSPVDHFQPSHQLLNQALSLGLNHVEDPKVLHEFIAHAKARGLHYHDWDAAFLQWLIRGERFMNKQTRKTSYARASTQKSETSSLVDKIRQQQGSVTRTPNVVFLSTHRTTGHPDSLGDDDSCLWT